jgi:hypothetical protein
MKNFNYCQRCKVMESSLIKCCKCEIKICKKCVNIVFPNVKEDINENILSDYCYYGCNENIKYCNICGNNVSNVKRCNGCYVPLCYNCKNDNFKNEIIDKNIYLTENEKYKLLNYCSISCYIIHTNYDKNKLNNCKNCNLLFINPFKYKYCKSCRVEQIMENNIIKNRERKLLQNKVNILLENKEIKKEHIIKFSEKQMNVLIKKYKNIYENKITFEQWFNDENTGDHKCMNLWDLCIIKYI